MFRLQQTWNDAAILRDNNPATYPSASAKVYSILQNLNQAINPVVRYDSSGTSEVFTSALALMDPPCASMGAALTGLTKPSCQNWYDSPCSVTCPFRLLLRL